ADDRLRPAHLWRRGVQPNPRAGGKRLFLLRGGAKVAALPGGAGAAAHLPPGADWEESGFLRLREVLGAERRGPAPASARAFAGSRERRLRARSARGVERGGVERAV